MDENIDKYNEQENNIQDRNSIQVAGDFSENHKNSNSEENYMTTGNNKGM